MLTKLDNKKYIKGKQRCANSLPRIRAHPSRLHEILSLSAGLRSLGKFEDQKYDIVFVVMISTEAVA